MVQCITVLTTSFFVDLHALLDYHKMLHVYIFFSIINNVKVF